MTLSDYADVCGWLVLFGLVTVVVERWVGEVRR